MCAAPPAYPISFSGTGTYIEAEDYSSIGVGASGAESGANCTNNTDDDGDGVVNDGCPIVGTGPETMCNDKVDSAIVIQIARDHAEAGVLTSESSLGGDVCEREVALSSPFRAI